MKVDSAQEAISAALRGEWEKAIEINQSILKDEPNDVDALNRLARAYSEKGDLKKAKLFAQTVLKIDPFNTIAARCLKKWKSGPGYSQKVSQGPKDPKTYLEESGKTKITSLLHLGNGKTLASLDTGDELKLSTNKHKVSVLTLSGSYVGKLTDDLSARLNKLIKFGNKYEVLVKSIDSGSVKIFIRETERSEKMSDTPSFATERIDYISFTPPELVHKKESIRLDEE